MKKTRSISRLCLNEKIMSFGHLVKPPILDVGTGRKTTTYPFGYKFPDYVTFDLCEANEPDIVGDAASMSLEDGRFNCVLCNQLLEHVPDPSKVVNEIYRVLKDDGACILSVPFMYRIHPDPKDYWRFTPDSLRLLFKDFRSVEVRPYGGKMSSIWSNLALGRLRFLQRLNGVIKSLDSPSDEFALGYVVYAKK